MRILCRYQAIVIIAMTVFFRVAIAQEAASHEFRVKDVKISYLTEGQGPTVVLLHGWHSSSDVNWVKPGIVSELAKSHRVVAMDLPGHGKSDKPSNEDAYGLQLVENVVVLLDELKVEKAHIVGYSIGGSIALKLTTMHPHRVESLTLGGWGWLRDGGRLQDVWERMPGREGAKTPPEFARSVGKLAVSEGELKKVSLPVKVIVGDRDPVKRLYVVPLQQARTDWPVVEVKDAGHFNCILKKEFKNEVLRWVKENTK